MSEIKVPVGYKQTEVGVIPNDWVIQQLTNIVENNGLVRGPFGGALKKESFVKKGYKVYEQRNAIYSSIDIGKYYITPKKYSELSRFSVNPDDFIVSCSGTIGKIFQIPKNAPKGIINQALLKIKLNNLIDSQYFYQVFNSDSFQNRITDSTQGGAMKNLIGMSEFKKSLILLPPKPEQTAIANALTDTDNLIQSLEKLIAKKEAIKTGTMQQLLTGKTRLPEFATREDGSTKGFKQTELGRIPEDWDLIEFSSLAKPASARVNPKVSGGGDYCIEMEHIAQREGRLIGHTETSENSSIKTIFQSGDILFGKLRSYLRKYWFSNRSGVCSTEIWVLRSDANIAFNKFLYYVVQTDRFIETTSEAYGTHMPRADWNVVKYFLVPTPSMPEQTAIATILSDMDAEIKALQDRLEKTKTIKQGMMQQLLTGKVRLVSPDQANNTMPLVDSGTTV